ncbi:hypothetical protein AB0B45_13565 [Nonomuraea sp. NPDC049152]|uniref:hypothetical protein n=1 Tax=Nonomuraea sp. NPDC049152 TaxID=3154350 RepID=UPI0033E20140
MWSRIVPFAVFVILLAGCGPAAFLPVAKPSPPPASPPSSFAPASSPSPTFKYFGAGNVRLTDVAARRRYLPGRIMVTTDGDTDAYCACSGTSGVRLGAESFEPGQTKEFWAMLALPSESAAPLKARIGDFPEVRVATD